MLILYFGNFSLKLSRNCDSKIIFSPSLIFFLKYKNTFANFWFSVFHFVKRNYYSLIILQNTTLTCVILNEICLVCVISNFLCENKRCNDL